MLGNTGKGSGKVLLRFVPKYVSKVIKSQKRSTHPFPHKKNPEKENFFANLLPQKVAPFMIYIFRKSPKEPFLQKFREIGLLPAMFVAIIHISEYIEPNLPKKKWLTNIH